MKRLLLALLLVAVMCSGCVSISEGEPSDPVDTSENITTEETTGQMDFETNVVSFEIEPNDGYPRYNAIVEVKNTGDVAINLGWTAFSVTDADNKLVATESSSAIYAQPSIIYPGEVGYYFAARMDLPSGIDTNQTYNLVYDTDYIRPANTEGVQDYEVVNVSLPEGDYTEMIGEIVNGSDTGDIDVMCICYDENGDIVTIGGTITELKTSHNTYFEIYNMAAWEKDNIADYKIIARTINYDEP